MREIPFDPNDPQAALRPIAPYQPPVDATPHHPQSWHSVAPPGYAPPPITPAAGGASPLPLTPQQEAAAFLAMPTDSAARVQTPIADALMSTATTRNLSVEGWVGLTIFESIFGFVGLAGVAVSSVLMRLFGGSGWEPRRRPRSTPRIR